MTTLKKLRVLKSEHLFIMEFALSESLGMGAYSSIREARKDNTELERIRKVLYERGLD